MTINISKTDAEQTLLKAFRQRCLKSDEICKKIKNVITGTHKTYKYVLVNGLLAKATNGKANPIALQAGAPVDGAFDARSLCHNVIVPFERDFLQNALGGSNEPFLNKPARFTHLSEDNAVRKGKDKETLLTLIYIFNSIKKSKDALAYLSCALELLSERITELKVLNDSSIKYNPTLIEIYEFIYLFLEKSFEGETSAIIVGAIEKIYYSRLGKDYKVVAHKVNQSGASSKETGDIDIFKGDSLLYSIEVKDKNFTEHDVEHAFSKIIQANGKKGEFIFGANATFDQEKLESKIKEFETKGFYTLLHDIYSYSKHSLMKIELYKKSEFVDSIFETANEINCKEETKKWIQELLTELNWK
ncbi:MAG: restriction endonuclease, SacI family [Candidatus Neomarinimicrobiota bacterium]